VNSKVPRCPCIAPIDQLQGVRNLPEADQRITSIDFELLAQPANVEPFVGFVDPRKIRDFTSRIS